MKLVALLPMRHQSDRVLGKNYRRFADRPLYHHILSSLLACSLISEVVINTDSPLITDEVTTLFPQVRLINRPVNLLGGLVTMNEILLHDVTQIDADIYLQTHSTNPLLQPETISRAINLFLENYPTYDSLFSVSRLQTRLWDHLCRPINHNPDMLLRTQDLPPIYEENSNLYLFTRQTLEQRRNRIGERPLMFEIDRMEAWDIDDENDFRIGELLYMNRSRES